MHTRSLLKFASRTSPHLYLSATVTGLLKGLRRGKPSVFTFVLFFLPDWRFSIRCRAIQNQRSLRLMAPLMAIARKFFFPSFFFEVTLRTAIVFFFLCPLICGHIKAAKRQIAKREPIHDVNAARAFSGRYAASHTTAAVVQQIERLSLEPHSQATTSTPRSTLRRTCRLERPARGRRGIAATTTTASCVCI